MTFTYRIFSVLESELRKFLSFSCVLDSHHSRPGDMRLRPGDRVRFRVWVRNDSGLKVVEIKGSVHASPLAQFARAEFDLARLDPGENREIAAIEALVYELPPSGSGLDQLATVNISASADLSAFRFRDSARPLGFVQKLSETATRTPGSAPRPVAQARSCWTMPAVREV